MNRKHIHEDITADNGEYAVRHNRKRDIVAVFVCLLLALVVWLLVMNADDTASVTLTLEGGTEAYSYTLSDDSLEVAGTVIFLKAAQRDSIVVKIPAEANAPGTYHIAVEELVLPEGVALTSLPELTLTVSEK